MEEGAVLVVVISPVEFAHVAIVVVLAVQEEAVGEVNIRILRHGTDESAAAISLVPGVRVTDESVIDGAHDIAVLEVVRILYVAHDTTMSRFTVDGATDLGADATVLNGEITAGRAYQTAHVVPIAAFNLSRCVQVTDGGTVSGAERSAIRPIGGVVERQRMAVAVERTLERMVCAASHRRHGDVVTQHHGLATETVQVAVHFQALTEVVPALGSLDGVGVAALREVVFIQRVRNCGVDSCSG